MKLRLSDNEKWAREFEATDSVGLDMEISDILRQYTKRSPISLHMWGSPGFSAQGWYNVRNIQMGVYYDPAHPTGPAMFTIRGYGHSFLRITQTDIQAARLWAEINDQPYIGPDIETVDLRPGQTPEQKNLTDIYNDLVSAARNQRRQIMFVSPKLPVDRAYEQEARRNQEMAEIGAKYRDAALAYRPSTDWADWAAYVQRTIKHPDIAQMVIAAVCE